MERILALLETGVEVNMLITVCDIVKPLYGDEETHGMPHVLAVLKRALNMKAYFKLDIPTPQIIVASLCHDIFALQDRKNHHILGAQWVKEHASELGLHDDDVEAVSHAILHHRASTLKEGTDSRGLAALISAADRDEPDFDKLVMRVWECASDPIMGSKLDTIRLS